MNDIFLLYVIYTYCNNKPICNKNCNYYKDCKVNRGIYDIKYKVFHKDFNLYSRYSENICL